ncbi:UDP-N-acetylmuramate--L-alanine ligase, partial [bacterium]
MLEKAKNIFFVGIGGIGISAIARVLLASGRQISGSELSTSEITNDLEQLGIKIFYGHSETNLPPDADLVIYSAAIPPENPERLKALSLNIPELSYPEALGQFAKGKKVIAIAGTNGKTTTTAMIATILENAGEDPTAIVGSKVLAWNSNARVGKGEYLILEADEYRRAFLHYHPDKAVITNIEPDHLDYYRDLDDIKRAFVEFAKNIKSGGALVYNLDNPNAREIAASVHCHKISFGFSEEAEVDPVFLEDAKLQVPGYFNLSNAMAAAAVCQNIGLSQLEIIEGLNNFRGTWRRFQNLGKFGNADIISDYAHHPDGVRVTLEAAAEFYRGKRVLVVFQPHQHNRTKLLFQDFVTSFSTSHLNHFLFAEIFDVAGRE